MHVTPDRLLFADGEVCAVPNGIHPSKAAEQALGSPAIDLGHHGVEEIHDGVSHAAVLSQPRHGLYASRLARAMEAGRSRDFATAVRAADRLMSDMAEDVEVTVPQHLETKQFRADLAYLTGDFLLATRLWTAIARSWTEHTGLHGRTRIAACNAAACWMELQRVQAVGLAPQLLDMLSSVAAPERTAAVRAAVMRRLGEVFVSVRV
ncbi:hypothetical protein GCM10010381_13940 [Streptomyces xantholiticus]|nr:hypothetical protein GCM10010381_13940 [Streptomyces xantholiticus]